MEHFGGGGNWGMIPNIQSHSNPATPSNQDHLFLQQQQFNQQQQFQQQFNQPQQQRFQQQPQQQSLASHFHLLHLVENLAEVTESGARDQQTDALVSQSFGFPDQLCLYCYESILFFRNLMHWLVKV
ncbi:hypothetical protein ACS0TY_035346 [Phlomoides rotata]